MILLRLNLLSLIWLLPSPKRRHFFFLLWYSPWDNNSALSPIWILCPSTPLSNNIEKGICELHFIYFKHYLECLKLMRNKWHIICPDRAENNLLSGHRFNKVRGNDWGLLKCHSSWRKLAWANAISNTNGNNYDRNPCLIKYNCLHDKEKEKPM